MTPDIGQLINAVLLGLIGWLGKDKLNKIDGKLESFNGLVSDVAVLQTRVDIHETAIEEIRHIEESCLLKQQLQKDAQLGLR